MELITLKGNAKVYVDMQLDKGRCRGCYKTIYWASTMNGKKMPIIQNDKGEWQSHFTDCPKSKFYRKDKGFVSSEDLDYKPKINGVETLNERGMPKI